MTWEPDDRAAALIRRLRGRLADLVAIVAGHEPALAGNRQFVAWAEDCIHDADALLDGVPTAGPWPAEQRHDRMRAIERELGDQSARLERIEGFLNL